MNLPAGVAGPSLQSLCSLFPPVDYLAGFELISPEEVPGPYDALLVHEHHMTVTVEAYHGGPVDVCILERRQTGDTYARKILLVLHETGQVVQFGIAQINFKYCSPAVRQEIVAGGTPLGRVLIQHNVLRRVRPTAFLRIVPGSAMMKWFELVEPTPVYGRLAIIYCDDQPAIEVLEIVRPEDCGFRSSEK